MTIRNEDILKTFENGEVKENEFGQIVTTYKKQSDTPNYSDNKENEI